MVNKSTNKKKKNLFIENSIRYVFLVLLFMRSKLGFIDY